MTLQTEHSARVALLVFPLVFATLAAAIIFALS